MAPQMVPVNDMPAAESDEEIKALIEKAKAEANEAQVRAKAEEKAKLKARKALGEVQEVLKITQAKLDQERQARIKAEQDKVETERALAEALKTTGVKAESMEIPPITLGEGGAEQRVSFAVRVTVDKRGEPRRTEIEHAGSREKETFPGLEVQRLAAFMERHTGMPTIQKPGRPPATPPASVSEPPTPPTSLTVTAVKVYRVGAPDVPALNLSHDEGFNVQAGFRLEGTQASSLTDQESPFEIKVYAQEVTRTGSTLLTTYHANLLKHVIEYTARMHLPGFSPGLYRLVTLVTLRAPINIAGFYEGPIIQMI